MNITHHTLGRNIQRILIATGIVASVLSLIATLTTALPAEAATASGATNYYIDNAGGKQPMRIKKANGNKRPAIIFVHGGGWAVDGGTFDPAFQNRAAANGFTSFRIKYRLMPGGVHEQLQDVLRAARHIKANAAAYNIDPNKIAIWGDSAGGSLTVRAAASGKSGTAAAVGWSAPTNAFRDLFHSPQSFADGIFHSRCFGEYFPPQTMDVINFLVDNQSSAATLQKLGSGQPLSPAESSKLLNQSLELGGIILSDLPGTFGKLDKAANDFGFVVNKKALGDGTTPPADDSKLAPISRNELEKRLKTLTPEQTEQIGIAIYQFNRMAQSGTLGDDDETLNTMSILQQGISEIVDAQNRITEEKTGQDTDTTIPLITRGDSTVVGINPQQISAKKIAQCMDDFVQLSPSLIASPRTPPMYLANYTKDHLVPIQDAFQMRDKLRSMGIRSEVFTINGPGHMGYARQAETPSFRFLKSVLRV